MGTGKALHWFSVHDLRLIDSMTSASRFPAPVAKHPSCQCMPGRYEDLTLHFLGALDIQIYARNGIIDTRSGRGSELKNDI